VRHLTGNGIIMEQFRATLEDVKTITYSDIELLMDFSGHLQSFLSRKNPLLPEEPEHSADVSNGSQPLSGLNDLAQMREELVQITEDIIFRIRGLRPEQATPAPAWVN